MDTTEKNKQFLFKMGGWLLVVLTVLALAGVISLAKGWRFIGAGLNATNIISVSAEASSQQVELFLSRNVMMRRQQKKQKTYEMLLLPKHSLQ